MSLIAVVIGMGRSGTSFLVHALQKAGMYLGTDLMDDPHCDNLEGHGEALEAIRINERILSLSGGSWGHPPSTVRGDAEIADRMEKFLAQLSAQPIAGWKDPRTTITFPVWKPHLSNYRVVAALRHPLKVARSLMVRESYSADFALNMWATYNEHLLRIADAESQDIYWIDFDLPADQLLKSVETVCERLQLPDRHLIPQVFNPLLRHHTGEQGHLEPRIQQLYDRLKTHAARFKVNDYANVSHTSVESSSGQTESHVAGNVATHVPATDLTHISSEWRTQRDHLVRVQNAQNAVIQRADEAILLTRNRVEETGAKLAHLELVFAEQVDRKLEGVSARLARIEGVGANVAQMELAVTELRKIGMSVERRLTEVERKSGPSLGHLFVRCWRRLKEWSNHHGIFVAAPRNARLRMFPRATTARDKAQVQFRLAWPRLDVDLIGRFAGETEATGVLPVPGLP